VQVNNTTAIEFYKRFGFEIVTRKSHYYKRIEPADAHVLQKTIRPQLTTTTASRSQQLGAGELAMPKDPPPHHGHHHHHHHIIIPKRIVTTRPR